MFDEAQLQCLRAALDTIIPADEYPAAWEAGVGEYIQRQLTGDLAHLQGAYRAWLAGLDAEALAIHAMPFASLRSNERIQLLESVDAGDVAAAWSLEPGAFFRQIVEHCAEGYYSDPGNGGNRDGIAWRMIGFEVSG